MPLETGYDWLADGVRHVAIRTDTHGCTGAMLDWWFGSRPATREYRWWHPIDHISSAWAGGTAEQVIGATHLVEERFTAMPPDRLSIQFRDPTEALNAAALADAQADGAVSAAFLAHGGAGHDAQHTADGKVIGSRMVHLCRDTGWGMVLRSHFFLGHDLPARGMPPAALADILPDALGQGLLKHCYDEFTSRLLSGLYDAESGAVPATPW